MQELAMEVSGLRVRYPGAAADAVAGIDFAVGSGEIFGFLGPNGAGKSTTQRVLTGLLRAYQGTAVVLGRDVRDWGSGLYERVGVGFELPAHYPRLTCRENLAAFAGLYHRAVMPPDEALSAVGLIEAADQRAAELSKGMQMRLNLARAMLHQPEVLFLDEPTSGLDPVHAAEVRAVIRAQAAEGRTVFLTTHDMTTADEVCDRVGFMCQGRLVAVGAPRELRLAHGRPTVVVEHVVGGLMRRDEYATTADPALGALLATGTAQTVHTQEATLGEVFLAVTGGAL